MKLHHIAISVQDIDTQKQWYVDTFGFAVKHEYEKSGRQFCMLEKEGLRLELIRWGETQQPVPEYRRELATDLEVGGVKHICFEVDSVETEIERLRESGAAIKKEIDSAGFGGRYFFLSDPEGNLLELWSAD